MSRIRNAAAAAALGAAFATALPAFEASAQYYHHPRKHYRGEAVAAGVAAGVLGGLAAGALMGAARPAPVYAAPAAVYVAPPPVYVEPAPVYLPTCHIVRRKVWLDDYAWTWRRERVCE